MYYKEEESAAAVQSGNDISSSSTLSHRILGLAPGAFYQISVRAVNIIGEGVAARIGTRTLSLDPPGIPGTPRVTVLRHDSITVEWAASIGGGAVENYLVHYRLEPPPGGEQPTEDSRLVLAPTTFARIPADANSRYTISVSAESLVEGGRRESTRSGVLEVLTNALSEPTSIVITPEIEALSVSWEPPATTSGLAIDGYRVYWTDAEGSENNSGELLSSNTRSYTIDSPPLTNGATYLVEVAATSDDGREAARSVPEMGIPRTIPEAPTSLSASVITSRSITVSWRAPERDGGAPIISYLISWSTDLEDEEGLSTESIVPVSTTSYVISGLRPETIYQIAVAGVNRAGIGNRTTLTIQTASPELPSAPTQLNLGAVTTKSIAVAWDVPESIFAVETTGYIVYWTAFGRTLEFSRTVNVSTTSYVIRGLDVKTRYHITVAAVNSYGRPGARSTPLVGRTLGLAAMEAQVIAAGNAYSCALYNDAAWCWGNDGGGLLGRGNSELVIGLIPDLVQALDSGVTAISAFSAHTCVIQDAAAKCWGFNPDGQLGNDSVEDSNTPVRVEGLSGGVTAISAGDFHSCAVQRGVAWCWGFGGFGKLGNGSTNSSSIPVQVDFDSDSAVTAIDAGAAHSCAIHGGAAKCWGDNFEGLLGDAGRSGEDGSSMPVQVEGLDSDVTAISVGVFHSCAVQRGEAWCWGDGSRGKLGNGGTANSNIPVQVQGLGLDSSVTVITVGEQHSCAVQRGEAWCWGEGSSGQLGHGRAEYRSTPVRVRGLDSGVTAIDVGTRHTCAIQYGVTKCWGSGENSGGLGTGRLENSNTPLEVRGLSFAAPLQLLPGTVTGYSIAVSWSPLVLAADMPAITNYLVSWGTDLDDEDGLSTVSVSVPTTSYVVPRLRAETSYQIAVAGVNRGGIGNRIVLTIQTTQAELPSAPQELRLGGVTTNTIVVSWKLPNIDGGAAITGYRISWVDPSPGGISGVATPTETSYKITNLALGRTYQITVVAENRVGPGEPARLSTRTKVAAPEAPQNLVVIGNLASDSIEVGWEAPLANNGEEVTAYRVYYKEEESAASSTQSGNDISSSSTLRHRILGLAPGTLYQISVSAVNIIGEGVAARIGTRTLSIGSPGIPGTPRETVLRHNSIAVEWPASIGGGAVDRYLVYYRLEPPGGEQSTEASLSVFSSNDIYYDFS